MSISPLSVRTAETSAEGGYELIAGHRRRHVLELTGIATMLMIMWELYDEATLKNDRQEQYSTNIYNKAD